jgi:hypothetical protein
VVGPSFSTCPVEVSAGLEDEGRSVVTVEPDRAAHEAVTAAEPSGDAKLAALVGHHGVLGATLLGVALQGRGHQRTRDRLTRVALHDLALDDRLGHERDVAPSLSAAHGAKRECDRGITGGLDLDLRGDPGDAELEVAVLAGDGPDGPREPHAGAGDRRSPRFEDAAAHGRPTGPERQEQRVGGRRRGGIAELEPPPGGDGPRRRRRDDEPRRGLDAEVEGAVLAGSHHEVQRRRAAAQGEPHLRARHGAALELDATGDPPSGHAALG